MSDVLVSISCVVYNHAPYLRRCLDSLVNQKTNFNYEILIHDDASTDGSAEIIREYEEKYPHLIKAICQTENQHSKGVKIYFTYQHPRAAGKYFAMCEGDDYWCDEHKLQRQVDAMEQHPECTLCVHRVQGVNVDETSNGKFFPAESQAEGVYDGKEMVRGLFRGNSYPFQTSSYLYRTEYYTTRLPEPYPWMRIAISGDVVRLLYLGDLGDIYYLDDVMSCNRMNVAGSFSARTNQNLGYRVKAANNFIQVLKGYDEYTNGRYRDLIKADVAQREFNVLKMQFRTKEMKSPPYRERYRAMPFIQRVCYSLVQYLPFTKPLMYRLRAKLRIR